VKFVHAVKRRVRREDYPVDPLPAPVEHLLADEVLEEIDEVLAAS
jgi:hypothetical protein